MKRILFLLLFSSCLTIISCDSIFEYSPYVIDFDEENTNLNNKSIAKIISRENPDSIITIALTGDTHRSFDIFDEYVKSVNQLNNSKPIDFVVHVGDIADFGLPKQYLWSNSYLQKLDMPYITVLGNHDLVGNGADAFKEMFGEFNSSFIYKSIKFISINTNSLEFGFDGSVPDINWLDAQLKPNNNFKKAVVMFHVPPTDVDFDKNLEQDFISTLSRYNNVILATHGHLHHFDIYYPYSKGILFLNVYSVDKHKYNVVNIYSDTVKISTYDF